MVQTATPTNANQSQSTPANAIHLMRFADAMTGPKGTGQLAWTSAAGRSTTESRAALLFCFTAFLMCFHCLSDVLSLPSLTKNMPYLAVRPRGALPFCCCASTAFPR